MSSAPASPSDVRTFRLPALAYLIVLFLTFCTVPLAFGTEHAGASPGPRAVLMLFPVLVAVFIARARTVVGTDGVSVRAIMGTRLLPWHEIRGLSVTGTTVYLVCRDGAVRLPCVRISDLASVSRASGGRLPEVPEVTPRFAPSRRRR